MRYGLAQIGDSGSFLTPSLTHSHKPFGTAHTHSAVALTSFTFNAQGGYLPGAVYDQQPMGNNYSVQPEQQMQQPPMQQQQQQQPGQQAY